MPSVLITGANRGLGLEHAKQYLAQGWDVFACCRHPDGADELQNLLAAGEKIKILEMDVCNHAQIDACAETLKDETIDILWNNAGILGPSLQAAMDQQTLDNMPYENWREIFEINVLSVFKVTQAFIGQIASSEQKKVVMMSSELGSIAGNTMGGIHAYRTSKVALNMLARGLAVDLKERGITVLCMAPGWCKTDMGTQEAPVEVVESIAGQQKVVAAKNIEDSGKFFNHKNEEVAW